MIAPCTIQQGWKNNKWELKGIPCCIEIVPSCDVEDMQARIVVPYKGKKVDIPVTGGLSAALVVKLEEIQHRMFEKAKKFREDHLVKVMELKDWLHP